MHPTASRAALKRISSVGFSGAGFLACYHLGVVSCLTDQGVLFGRTCSSDGYRSSDSVVLTGVSGGALVAAAVVAGIDVATGMQTVLNVSQAARCAGRLDALQPGFSLIDVVEGEFSRLFREAVRADPEAFLQRACQGLRIGLTDRRVFPPFGYNPNAFLYVDSYRSIDDVIAACILSSYVPGVTGPALGSMALRNHAVVRAAGVMTEMMEHGCVKKGATGETLKLDQTTNETTLLNRIAREVCWDGGLVNAFPTIDKDTVIVSPIAADFKNASISPAIEYDSEVRMLALSPIVNLHLTAANAATLRCMVLSSEDAVLEAKFAQGYDNAARFLKSLDMVSVHRFANAAGKGAQRQQQNAP
jgi:hypothetical protein